MLFNSIEFVIFLPIVFLLYWFVFNRSIKIQNTLLLVASYIFYGWWDWRFLSLIIFSSIIDFSVGLQISKNNDQRIKKGLLLISLIVNLGLLGLFKYFNFFVDSFSNLISIFGMKVNPTSLNLILPVGISFYTFQTLSYTIDVYKGKLKPTKDIIAFFAFVSFFPQLVAGPIERATNLLKQFNKKREFNHDKATDGLRQILWGLFKKIVIADNCAIYANLIFNNSADHSGGTLMFGALFFTFQIYGDFSGYSDIAIGTARLFGFDLMRNFAYPYFSRDIAEFWRRWHISLSTWFRDYLYIPLGGSENNKIRNIFIIFIVSGFWHGANLTFIVWGLLNAIYYLPLMLMKNNRNNLEIVAKGKILPSLQDLIGIITTFSLTVIAWIFFRAENISHAIHYITGIFSKSIFTISHYQGIRNSLVIIILVIIFVIIEWVGREEQYAIAKLGIKLKRPIRYAMYYAIILAIFWFQNGGQEFIYFQF